MESIEILIDKATKIMLLNTLKRGGFTNRDIRELGAILKMGGVDLSMLTQTEHGELTRLLAKVGQGQGSRFGTEPLTAEELIKLKKEFDEMIGVGNTY